MLMKYKDLGKNLSKDEMKNVNGGLKTGSGLPTCTYCEVSNPDSCGGPWGGFHCAETLCNANGVPTNATACVANVAI